MREVSRAGKLRILLDRIGVADGCKRRRQRDANEAEALRAWGVRDAAGNQCSLVDIGANLVKLGAPEVEAKEIRSIEYLASAFPRAPSS